MSDCNRYFSTLLPPPNLTGILHLGHTWNAILQDVLVRYYSNSGVPSYWGYGLDHAGISLQIKVEQNLRKKDLFKNDLSTEDFQKELLLWKDIHVNRIRDQYRQLNLSLPLEDERFTMDSRSVDYVNKVFKKLYLDGFVYRSKKIVNWDIRMNTVISDSEIVYKPEKVKLYRIKYYFESNKSYLEVSTTRPETIFADVAIVINPKDSRYSELVGKFVTIPLLDKKIPVIADEYVDMDFGTGAMKCTPAHDFNDYALGKKHNLEMIEAYGKDLNIKIGPYSGMSKFECRDKLVADLLKDNLVTVEDYETSVSYSSRSDSIVEPLLSKQWFLKSSELSKTAWHKISKTKLFHSSFDDEYIERLFLNMEDWCISRQLDWGIKIPVFLNDELNTHSLEPKPGLKASNDVFDTWFSSSLWPLIVFEDKPNFFPISSLISGKDILLLWIIRMIFMSVYIKSQSPFKSIYLHGLVLDSQNRKMSKSLDNGIDPLDLISETSLDSLRLFFLSNTHPNKNIVFSRSKIDYFSKFIHKFKNSYEFVKKQKIDFQIFKWQGELNLAELQMLKDLQEFKTRQHHFFKTYRFSDVANHSMEFVRDIFCNRYLEMYKLLSKESLNSPGFLSYVWKEVLIILQPLIPNLCDSIINEIYCGTKPISINTNLPKADYDFSWFYEYLKIYTDIRKRLNIPVDFELEVELITSNKHKYEQASNYFRLLNHKVIDIRSCSEDAKCIFNIPESDLIVSMKFPEKLQQEYFVFFAQQRDWLLKEIDFFKAKLSNPQFTTNASKEIIQEYENKLRKFNRDLQVFLNV